MTFRLTKTRLYWWPVQVKQPISDPDPKKSGRFEKVELKIQFESIEQDAARANAAEIAALPKDERDAREHELLERAVKDWTGVVDDETNETVPFSLDAFRIAMQQSWFRIGVYEAWVASTTGEEARRKN